MTRQRVLRGLVACLLVGGLAVVVVGTTRSAQPTYVSVGDGIALGPTARHTRGPTDLFAQIATGALDSAAGNAGGDLLNVGDALPTPQEQALLDLTNADRTSHGLAPLQLDMATLRVARVRAAAQIPDGPLSHYNNLGEVAFVGLLGDAGVSYVLAGENLARATAQDANVVARLDQALMNSPTHRANILEPSFNRLAVGAASGPDGRLAFAQIFRSASEPENQAAARFAVH
jgi:uncharacterized protein YkwD